MVTFCGSTRIRSQLVFDAERDSPEVFAALVERRPQVRMLCEVLRRELVLDTDCAHGRSGQYYRLPTHFRSVAFALDDISSGSLLHTSPVLIFKGSEPLLGDFVPFLEWMLRAPFRTSALPMGLYFPLQLRMPPGAVPIDEAVREQRISTALQLAHVRAYRTLAPTPIPLLVHSVDRERVEGYLDLIRTLLPDQAFEKVEERVRVGLGLAVSYYQASPIRVDDLFAGSPWLRSELPHVSCERLESVIASWVLTTARMIRLDYLPYAGWNAGWGSCVDPGNACIDGGFADLLTLVPFASVVDARQMRLGVRTTVELLTQSVARFCSWAEGWQAHRDVNESELLSLVSTYLHGRLRQALAADDPAGGTVHPWAMSGLEIRSVEEMLGHARSLARRPVRYSGA